MNTRTAIKSVMKDTGTTQLELAYSIGMRSQTAISEKLKRKNISFDAVRQMLEAMDYEIVFRPNPHRTGPEYVIDGEDD